MTWIFAEQLAQDMRYGLRAMAAGKLFTAMAVLSLALGIGANTAIYSFMDAVLLRSLPVPHPDRLEIVKWRAAGNPKVIHRMNGTRYREGKTGSVSPNYPFAAYQALQNTPGPFSTLFAYASARQLNLLVEGQAEVAAGQYVSGNFFSGLGVNPAAGRLILEEDDRAGAAPVVVIGYNYWQRRFALSPSAIGKQMAINRVPFTIAGVTAPGFFGLQQGLEPPLFLPLHAVALLAPKPAEEEKSRFADPNFYWVEMMGRLRPGVSPEQAQTLLAGQFRRFVSSTAATSQEKAGTPDLFLEQGASGIDSLRRRYSKPLLVLMAMTALILAIACANIANLLLARATTRRREMAVRLSLGAGHMRIVRQLLTESLLLSMAGAALGLLVALWGIRSITWLLATGLGDQPQLGADLNWPVLGFTLAIAVATGIVFGLVPAMQSTRVEVAPTLKETRAGASGKRARGFGLSQALVVSQIAISLVLVIAAGLFVRTLANLHAVDLGFNRENLLLFNVDARQAGYRGAAVANFYAGLVDRFHTIPGVQSAGLSQFALVSHYWNSEWVNIPGKAPSGKRVETCLMSVDRSFLATMQIPILLGRGLSTHDMQSPRVAVVSEQFAKQFFPGQNPLGQRVGFGDAKTPADIEIVGVARNSRYNDLRNENPPVAYVPYTQDLQDLGGVTMEIRTAGDPLALAGSVRQIVRQAGAAVPVSNVTTQAAAIDEITNQERTFADLCTCFALLALTIACVGLYGTMAYTVARRTGEIGIRVALGAERARIVRMVLRQVLAMTAAGVIAGLATAWETAHFVASFLFGVKPLDPWTMCFAAVALIALSAAAAYGPARRASRIDPMTALRHE